MSDCNYNHNHNHSYIINVGLIAPEVVMEITCVLEIGDVINFLKAYENAHDIFNSSFLKHLSIKHHLPIAKDINEFIVYCGMEIYAKLCATGVDSDVISFNRIIAHYKNNNNNRLGSVLLNNTLHKVSSIGSKIIVLRLIEEGANDILGAIRSAMRFKNDNIVMLLLLYLHIYAHRIPMYNEVLIYGCVNNNCDIVELSIKLGANELSFNNRSLRDNIINHIVANKFDNILQLLLTNNIINTDNVLIQEYMVSVQNMSIH